MYRDRQRHCPACREPMHEVGVPVTDAEPARVDLCRRCGGVYLDFFDGEPGELSRGVLESHLDELVPASDLPPAGAVTPSCPDCEAAMSSQRYMNDGPAVWRCAGCQAIFATRVELEALARFRLPDEPVAEAPSLFARLRRFFG